MFGQFENGEREVSVEDGSNWIFTGNLSEYIGFCWGYTALGCL